MDGTKKRNGQRIAMFCDHKKGKQVFFLDGERNEFVSIYHQKDGLVWKSKKDSKAGGAVGSVLQKSDGFCFGVFDLSKDLHLINLFKVFKREFFPSFFEVEEKNSKSILKVEFFENKVILKDYITEQTLGSFEPNVDGMKKFAEKASYEIQKYLGRFN